MKVTPHAPPAIERDTLAEIPNDDLLASMKEAEEMIRKGNLHFMTTVDEMMAALD